MAANDNKNEDKKPLGQSIRDLIEPALDDPRRNELQLQKLDHIFNQLAQVVPRALEQEFNNFARYVENASERNPEVKHPMIIDALTAGGDQGYSPIKKFGLPISTEFTDFAANDIKELPNYIKLHEVARDLDVALKLLGVTADEAKGGFSQAILVVDGSKTYAEGALENSTLYPNLPPKPQSFDRKSGKEFKM
jgi:hypothetical protein